MVTKIAIVPLLLALIPAAAAQTSNAGGVGTGTPVEGREWIVIVDIVILVSLTRFLACFDNKTMSYHVLSMLHPADSCSYISGDDYGRSGGDPG
jgi:hypothetical protein